MSPKDRAYVALADLPRSLTACRRVEDELLRRIQPLTIDDRGLASALEEQRATPPKWCEPKAWARMIDSTQGWIVTYGDLRRWQELRMLAK